MSESNKGYWSSQEVWVNFAEGEMIELTSEEKGINSEGRRMDWNKNASSVCVKGFCLIY